MNVPFDRQPTKGLLIIWETRFEHAGKLRLITIRFLSNVVGARNKVLNFYAASLVFRMFSNRFRPHGFRPGEAGRRPPNACRTGCRGGLTAGPGVCTIV